MVHNALVKTLWKVAERIKGFLAKDFKTESMMTEYISQLMKWNQAPPEAFARLQI